MAKKEIEAIDTKAITAPTQKLQGFDTLKDLALDLIWSWTHNSDKIWQKLDAELWDLTHNPWIVIQTVSKEKLQACLEDPSFCSLVEAHLQEKKARKNLPTWFAQKHSQSLLTSIAYFSMEFMLSEALPIYSGGLGNVAGDQLKAAADLGVPVSAVGLLYQQGYFRQVIDQNGMQQALYPYNDPGQLPIQPLRKPDGEWLRIEIPLPGWSLWLRAWYAQVGRVNLYLLDSNDPANFPAHRGITSELYGGGSELRLKQELVLGIGGWRLLKALGIEPQVCHLNEGHAAFAILERARCFMKQTGHSFDVALQTTRAGNLFTTHTAVAAGFDLFAPSLIEQYLTRYAQTELKIDIQNLLALGRQDPQNRTEPFNMAYLAIRGSGAINGVSKLHGQVSRQIFAPLFPRWPEAEVPVGSVTNGIHTPSWDSPESDDLWTTMCGTERWQWTTEHLEEQMHGVSDEILWEMRNQSRKRLIEFTRKKLYRQEAALGASSEALEVIKSLFNPHVLTLGFARRFATYKRPDMLIQDPDRFARILTNPQRPVQLILAGKAHPQDKPGQALIKEWIDFIKRSEVRPHVIFLSDYDMLLTENLVQGVDVWINTPRRPWEACGTSGMKVLANGGLNVSELDGWWAEAYRPDVGWAIGDGHEHMDIQAWDQQEAHTLYDVLEQQVIPEFYNRDSQGLPRSWIRKMHESISRLTPHFSANRTVREYTESYYLSAAENYSKRANKQGSLGEKMTALRRAFEQQAPHLRFGSLKVKTEGNIHLFNLQIYLGTITPSSVKVELFADSQGKAPPFKQQMLLTGTEGEYHLYETSTLADRPISDYTPRLIPNLEGASLPLEFPYILWQR